MDLRLKGKVAVVTGASKGIGLAVTKALVVEGVRVIAGARDIGGGLAELAEGGMVHPLALDLSTPDGPQKQSGKERIRWTRHSGQQRRRGRGASRRLLGSNRRRVVGVTEPEFYGGGTNNARGAAHNVEARSGKHRYHQLSQFVSAGPRDHRLHICKGCAQQLFEGVVQGGRPERNTRKHRKSRAGRDSAVARSARRRSDGGESHGSGHRHSSQADR